MSVLSIMFFTSYEMCAPYLYYTVGELESAIISVVSLVKGIVLEGLMVVT